MIISFIRAALECDCCGKPFKVDIEPSTKNWMRRQDMLSIAENAIRGEMTSDGEFCSIQADMHLCGDCTAVAAAIRPDEDAYQPPADETKRKVGALPLCTTTPLTNSTVDNTNPMRHRVIGK